MIVFGTDYTQRFFFFNILKAQMGNWQRLFKPSIACTQ